MLSLAQTLKALSQNVKTVKDNLTSIKNQIVTTIKVINVLAKELGIESGLNDNLNGYERAVSFDIFVCRKTSSRLNTPFETAKPIPVSPR